MALARFLIGEQLSFEAIGVLDDAFRTHPALGGEGEFRALRGMSEAMAGRYKEAQADLGAPVLDDNPAASLWKGYVLAKTSQWADAKTAFAAGASALSQFPPIWKQRFARAAAETALALGDVGGARSWIGYALQNLGDADEDAQTKLIDARVAQQAGDGQALAKFQALTDSPLDNVAGPALLHATQIQLTQGAISPAQAIDVYDSPAVPLARRRVRTGDHPRARPALPVAGALSRGAGSVPLRRQGPAGPARGDPAAGRPHRRVPRACSSTGRPTACSRCRRWRCSTIQGADPGRRGRDAMVRRLTRRLWMSTCCPRPRNCCSTRSTSAWTGCRRPRSPPTWR
ncbi:MAG: hypothetical protein WDM85_03210 [Caulobacteraceae bacterium]